MGDGAPGHQPIGKALVIRDLQQMECRRQDIPLASDLRSMFVVSCDQRPPLEPMTFRQVEKIFDLRIGGEPSRPGKPTERESRGCRQRLFVGQHPHRLPRLPMLRTIVRPR